MGRGRRVPGAAHGQRRRRRVRRPVRISLRVDGDRVAAAGFDAVGLRRADRRRLGRRRARRRRAACSTPRGSARTRSPPSSAGSRRASCTPPTSPPTRCTARSARAARAGAALAPDAEPHAGRDERRRRLRRRRAARRRARARRGRGDARAVGRPGQRRRGVVLLGARRARRPRGRARHGHAAPHARPARGVPRRRRRPVPGRPRGGRDAEPVRALQRPRAARRDARRSPTRSAPPTLATGHYARAHATDGLLRAAADPAKDQTYMLAARRARDARAAALPARRADQAARCARSPPRPGCRSPAKRRLAGPLLPRRHRQGGVPGPPRRARATRPGDIVDARRARARRATAATTTSRSASARASASAAAEPLYVLAHRRAPPTAWSSGRAAALATRTVAVRGARLHRAAAPRSTAVKLRYRSRPVAVPGGRRRASPRAPPRLELELDEPVDGAAPGQTACLLAGDVVVGWATIGPAQPPASSTSAM